MMINKKSKMMIKIRTEELKEISQLLNNLLKLLEKS